MKKYLIAIVLALTSVNLWAQENFKWDIITESSKNQEQLYSDVKSYINEIWQASGKELVQEDETKGFLLCKSDIQITRGPKIGPRVYTFELNTKFYVKDGKHRIVVDNVFCTSSVMSGVDLYMDMPKPPVADAYPDEKGKKQTGMTKKMYTNLMNILKSEIQKNVDGYLKYMSSDTQIDTDW